MTYRIAFSTMALDSKIPPGSPLWQEFNSSFENLELDSIDIANGIYTGHPFTTWHANSWRNSDNYQCGQHIGIDFDTEDNRSTLTSLSNDPFVAKYADLVYTTPSHTEIAPRARVLFLLDQPIMQAKNYTLATAALLWLFGSADRQCKDPCRFFYGSIDCEFEYMMNVLPLDVVKGLIREYQRTGEQTKRKQSGNYKPSADQAEVAQALKKIPPWGIDYDQWLRVLMGIHSEFGDSGLPLAEAWAQGEDGEVERKWRSFKQDGNGSGTTTIGTVFAIAKERGWERNAH